jgi:cell division protein FtsQ
MEKGERRRTMVYSNVNKKADKNSASNKRDIIDLDDEVFIGLAKQPEPKVVKGKKNKKKNKNNYKGNDDLKALWESEKEELKREEQQSNKKKNKFFSKKEDDDVQNDKENNQKKVNSKVPNKPKQINKPNNANQNKKVQAKQPKQLTIQDRIRKQKQRIIKRIVMFAMLIIIAIAGLIAFLLSPAFNIKKINVINNSNISTESIVSLSGIHINENMFKFSKREAKKSILSNPYIEEVKIKRKLFNNIEISVKERTATLMLEYGNSYVYINNQGYILEISTEKLDVPTITGYVTPLDQVKPGNRLGKEDLERLKTVLNIMEVASSNELDKLITKIDIKNKKDYILTLESEDKIVYLGEGTDLSTQMLYIKEMIEREKGIEGEFFIDKDLNTNNPVFREKV